VKADSSIERALWNQFEAWLAEHWPDGLAALNGPATETEIVELEDALGVRLPSDFAACLRIHNGQSDTAGGLFDNSEFLSTRAILEQWKVWKDLLDSGEFKGIESEPQSGIRNDWWHQKWIPITHNGGGDHYCIDLAPTAEGHCGQVITMWHDMAEREVQASSFHEWLDRYVRAVLSGRYVYSDDFGGLVRADHA
jgi:cell wall assembly regulator SMI1